MFSSVCCLVGGVLSIGRHAVNSPDQSNARRLARFHALAQDRRVRPVDRSPVPVHPPPPVLRTDNGAMIAACAHYRFDELRAGLDLDPQPGMRFAVGVVPIRRNQRIVGTGL